MCEAGHRDAPAGAKAPIQEVLHCPLSFASVHLLGDRPERSAVAYPYCNDLNADISQCVLILWGKVYHTWVSGSDYPRGPARLFWPVTGEDPFVIPPDAKLPPPLKVGAVK